ncbi:MAG: MBL fold metallo-hydrolase [Aquabacterium sp.]
MTRRPVLWTLLVIAMALGMAAWLARTPLLLAAAPAIAAQRLSADPVKDLPDGLHVGLCGAGSPFPDEQRAGPCTLVLAGQRLLVVDVGAGSVRNIGRMGFSHGRIDAVLLTHFHSDHIDGLGELMLQRWVAGARTEPLPVHGPPGIEQVVGGLMQAYAQDRHYRVAHHGAATVPPTGFGGLPRAFTLGPEGRVVVLREDDLEVVAFAVDHAPVHPAVGYRIAYKGRVVVISGDTKASTAVRREARGADLLVHEALSPALVAALREGARRTGRTHLVKIFDDIPDYHATPRQAAETARDAGARYLLLNHIVPALPLPGLEQAFLGGADDIFTGPLKVGRDGDFISMPAGSTAIQATRRF